MSTLNMQTTSSQRQTTNNMSIDGFIILCCCCLLVLCFELRGGKGQLTCQGWLKGSSRDDVVEQRNCYTKLGGMHVTRQGSNRRLPKAKESAWDGTYKHQRAAGNVVVSTWSGRQLIWCSPSLVAMRCHTIRASH